MKVLLGWDTRRDAEILQKVTSPLFPIKTKFRKKNHCYGERDQLRKDLPNGEREGVKCNIK